MRARSFGWFLVYLLACAALLGGVGLAIVRHRQDLLDVIAAYLLPESWRYAARSVAERFWRAQDKRVLLNACVGASFTVLALLFPLKEKLSATVERDARLTPEPGRPLPLVLQAIEEGWLALVFATAQMTLFFIGYPPVRWRQELALGLSWAVLFTSTGMSFLAPTWQRHRMRYFTIWKALLLPLMTAPCTRAGCPSAWFQPWTSQSAPIRMPAVRFARRSECHPHPRALRLASSPPCARHKSPRCR